MDIEHRIKLIEEDLETLRLQWKEASVPMKKIIEENAKKKKSEIRVLENVIKLRQNRPQPEDQQKLI